MQVRGEELRAGWNEGLSEVDTGIEKDNAGREAVGRPKLRARTRLKEHVAAELLRTAAATKRAISVTGEQFSTRLWR